MQTATAVFYSLMRHTDPSSRCPFNHFALAYTPTKPSKHSSVYAVLLRAIFLANDPSLSSLYFVFTSVCLHLHSCNVSLHLCPSFLLPLFSPPSTCPSLPPSRMYQSAACHLSVAHYLTMMIILSRTRHNSSIHPLLTLTPFT